MQENSGIYRALLSSGVAEWRQRRFICMNVRVEIDPIKAASPRIRWRWAHNAAAAAAYHRRGRRRTKYQSFHRITTDSAVKLSEGFHRFPISRESRPCSRSRVRWMWTSMMELDRINTWRTFDRLMSHLSSLHDTRRAATLRNTAKCRVYRRDTSHQSNFFLDLFFVFFIPRSNPSLFTVTESVQQTLNEDYENRPIKCVQVIMWRVH